MGHLSLLLFMSRGASEGIQILAGLMFSTAELSRPGRRGLPGPAAAGGAGGRGPPAAAGAAGL
eukprot:6979709-Pyramimonas_sp.AAC.1